MPSPFRSWFTDDQEEPEIVIVCWVVWAIGVLVTTLRLFVRWWYNGLFKPSDWVLLFGEVGQLVVKSSAY